MTKPPAFQFYVKDWLAGTRRLSWAAKGAYIDLLAWSWDNGPLPLRIKEIARVIGAVSGEFARLWRELARHWTRTPDGYINERLEAERRKQRAFRKLQSAKGRASAAGRAKLGSTTVQPKAQPKSNRPGSTDGQPSSALASASTEDQNPQDQNLRAVARDARPIGFHIHEATFAVAEKLAVGMFADVDAGTLAEHDATPNELKARIGEARLSFSHDPDVVHRAWSSAVEQRKRRLG